MFRSAPSRCTVNSKEVKKIVSIGGAAEIYAYDVCMHTSHLTTEKVNSEPPAKCMAAIADYAIFRFSRIRTRDRTVRMSLSFVT